MLRRPDVHHLLTHLNQGPRSTRCNNNNTAEARSTSSCLLLCTLDPFGTRATILAVNSRLSFSGGPETSMKTSDGDNLRLSNHKGSSCVTSVVCIQIIMTIMKEIIQMLSGCHHILLINLSISETQQKKEGGKLILNNIYYNWYTMPVLNVKCYCEEGLYFRNIRVIPFHLYSWK